ncbi:MAG: hypothetical protein HYV32_03490 [Candidatus Kerfeldbacteria bacterium]|nr:hypothetical protein [Candidatus Kerfeldbacteria bacterium]
MGGDMKIGILTCNHNWWSSDTASLLSGMLPYLAPRELGGVESYIELPWNEVIPKDVDLVFCTLCETCTEEPENLKALKQRGGYIAIFHEYNDLRAQVIVELHDYHTFRMLKEKYGVTNLEFLYSEWRFLTARK